jgi:hypothetical protein
MAVIKTQIAVSLVALLGSISTWAEGQNGITGSLQVKSEETDNALKSAENELSERQDSIGGSAAAYYENELLVLDSRYSVNSRRYLEDSQPDRTSTLGATSLRFGKTYNIAELLLSHSRDKVLSSADLADLEKNNDEREIILVQPTLHTSNDSANVVFVQASATDVKYRFEEGRNSSRRGLTTGWQRAISAVDSVALSLAQSDIEFDAAPQANYQMQVATLNYAAKLRSLQYLIELGQSRTNADVGDGYSEPYYNGQLMFENGYNQINLSVAQKISDSSFGSGASTIDASVGQGDIGSNKQEQILIRSADANWTTAIICGQCKVSLQINSTDRKYLEENRKERTIGIEAGFAYLISPAAGLGVRVNRREQTFSQVVPDGRTDFTLDSLNIYFNYKFVNNINARLSLIREEQVSENLTQKYDEVAAGLSVSYTFR